MYQKNTKPTTPFPGKKPACDLRRIGSRSLVMTAGLIASLICLIGLMVADLPVALSQSSVTLTPTADAYVRSGTNATFNYGGATTLEVKKSSVPTDNFNREAYLTFDLASVASIASGKLRLYQSANFTAGITSVAYQLSNPLATWVEGAGTGQAVAGINWNNKPATGAALATITLTTVAGWNEWDVTSFLQAEKAAGHNVVTLVVKNTVASTVGPIFNSRENAANKPQLVIGAGAPEVNVTGAGLPIPDGDTSPQTADNTDFGSADITTGAVQKVFNIQNTGAAALTLGSVTAGGDFAVIAQPPASIAAGGNANFTVEFNPSATGVRTATLSFTHNDTTDNESPYDFAVQGAGASAPARGAPIPWTYYEAEDGTPAGATAPKTGTAWDGVQAAFEARGRKTVELSTGGSITWTATAAADRVTVRYSIPDSSPYTPDTDVTGTLALYVKPPGGSFTKRADFPLSSFRLYTDRGASSAWPANGRFFDDVMVAATIAANDVIKVQKDFSDGLAYTIDFLETESASATPPLSQPSGSVAVVDGAGDDRQNILNAIDAAESASPGSGKVWFPAGVFRVDAAVPSSNNNNAIFVPAGMTISGAGMLHSEIQINFDAVTGDNATRRLFETAGTNITFRDFKIYDNKVYSRGIHKRGIYITADFCTVERIWTEYCGIHAHNCNNGIIRECRVRNTFSDGIHIATACANWLIEKNTVRNAGDDSIALISYGDAGSHHNTVLNNTIECNNFARGIVIESGDSAVVRFNVARNIVKAGIMAWTVDHNGNPPTNGCTNFVVESNDVINCGSDLQPDNQKSTAPAMAIIETASGDKPFWGRVENNNIIDNMFHGISIGGDAGDAGDPLKVVCVIGNFIDAPSMGTPWVHIYRNLNVGSNVKETPPPNTLYP